IFHIILLATLSFKCVKRSKLMMFIPEAFFITTVAAILIFSMTGMSYQQVQPPSDDEESIEEAIEESKEEDEEGAIEEGVCIDYDAAENTIVINCNASFLDVVQAINDPEILEEQEEEGGQYLLNANLQVSDGVTFAMTA